MRIVRCSIVTAAWLVPVAASLCGCGGGESAPSPAGPATSGKPAPTDGAAKPDAAPAATTAAPAKDPADPFVPPSDEQVRRDVVGNAKGVIEVKLSDQPGVKEWNSAHKQYFWEKSVVVKREAVLAGVKDAKLLVGGFARYEITGGTYRYREFKVSWNEYEGIPRPTDAEALAFLKAHLREFFGQTNNFLVHPERVSVVLAGPDEQEWVWHSPKSVSFNVRVKFDKVVSDTEIAAMDGLWEARFYRDEPQQTWQRLLGFEKSSTEVSRTKGTLEEIRDLPRGLK